MNQLARDEETALIARSQHGDLAAFNQLIVYYQQSLYTTVYRMLGDHDVAADVTQDACIAAFRAVKTFRAGSSFRAWLFRIGTNLACDHWRRVQRHPATSLEVLSEAEDVHGPSLLETLAIAGSESNPEEMLLSQELQAVIQRGLEKLSLDQRTAIILCDIEGLSYEEIAQATQTTMGTVRSRISRARAHLRDYLSQHKELLPREYRLSSNSDA